ncbi:TPA: hypothetical protein PWX43_002451, partial [Mannheimia haemolytica]|nr:hypothetical protein [Mannheimia haemolytica]HDL3641292.1 hypothetical protein [Mannheimia haemolytica]HDL3808523.1 hypothetical protein [Mannheimia haemolytica]HDL4518520.1 hypothetical protein [Mannheimia haemolytica]
TQKKYELLQNDTINHNGRTLYRIKAITTFGTVFAGTLGGYIEKESNLKHLGNAWVYDNAEVHDEKTKREYQLLIEVAKSRILGEAT